MRKQVKDRRRGNRRHGRVRERRSSKIEKNRCLTSNWDLVEWCSFISLTPHGWQQGCRKHRQKAACVRAWDDCRVRKKDCENSKWRQVYKYTVRSPAGQINLYRDYKSQQLPQMSVILVRLVGRTDTYMVVLVPVTGLASTRSAQITLRSPGARMTIFSSAGTGHMHRLIVHFSIYSLPIAHTPNRAKRLLGLTNQFL